MLDNKITNNYIETEFALKVAIELREEQELSNN